MIPPPIQTLIEQKATAPINEFAQACGFSRDTLIQWANNGKIAGISKIGSRYHCQVEKAWESLDRLLNPAPQADIKSILDRERRRWI
jgi:hypothetical protein